VIPRFQGDTIDETLPKQIERAKAGYGGFIVFGGQLPEVTAALQTLQREARGTLLIMSDLEQGLGQQVEGGTRFPPAMALSHAIDLGNAADAELFSSMIETLAAEARYAGIDTVLAPVADIHTNPENPVICTRAFGCDCETTARFVSRHIRTARKYGLRTCVKHFPGHGDTERDSHLELPVLQHDRARLNANELVPFRAAIAAGVSMVMIGHLKVSAFDPNRPASLSRSIVTDLLREELGFQGVIITDAMNMKGVREGRSEAEACLDALLAGCDLILHPEDPETVVSYLAENWSRIERRVEAAKERVGTLLSNTLESSSLGGKTDAPETLSFKLAEKSIQIEGEPFSAGNDACLVILDDDGEGRGQTLERGWRKVSPTVSIFHLDAACLDDLPDPNGRDVVVALFSRVAAWKGRSGLSPKARQAVKGILRQAAKTTLIVFGCPSLATGLVVDTRVHAWWPDQISEKVVVNQLCSKSS